MIIDKVIKRWLFFLFLIFFTFSPQPLTCTNFGTRVENFFRQDVRQFFEQDLPVFFKHRLPATFKLAGGKVQEFFVKDIPSVFEGQAKDFFQVQVADVINAKFVDKVIDKLEPQLKGIVDKELLEIKGDVIVAVHETVSKEVTLILSKEYPGEGFNWVRQKIYLPIKSRINDIINYFYARFIVVLSSLIMDANAFILQDIKDALKLYFGVGPKRQHRPIKVHLTRDGLYGFIQRKVEQMHADLMGELLPSLEAYIKGLKLKLVQFIQGEAVHTLLAMLGKLSDMKLAVKAVNWIVEQGMKLLDGRIASKLAETYTDASKKLDAALRKALYQPFWFLRDHIDSVQAQIDGGGGH